ncbi:MAG: bis-aminopropyl spermidine synthase family protein [Alphaproteobacteria bacterium]|nr:bis-aminopropyl spermidine synthase family protein [Alphaproteobacteria bacterium]
MADAQDVDLRAAINAISDVIQNRPRPLREFDQIYMKAGDMVMQSELIARWADGKRMAFIGDGDAISISIAFLQERGILKYGPTKITVFDFDERICNAVRRFADKERLHNLDAELYNCLEPFPQVGRFDFFYTNPPWGASNRGESVKVFVGRGMEAVGFAGEGVVVIADDEELAWPKLVLGEVQKYALANGFFVQKMMSQLHEYHLDDAPDLKSCNLMFKAISPERIVRDSVATPKDVLEHFYGRDSAPKVRYVREKKRVDYGKANEDEYLFEKIGGT